MDEKVAAIFWHIRPLLPMPVTTILPDVFNIRSTALEKFALSLLARPDMARASICKTRLAVEMVLSIFIVEIKLSAFSCQLINKSKNKGKKSKIQIKM